MSIVEGLLYPDTRDALYELVDGKTFAGYETTAFYQLPVDYAERSAPPNELVATALIYTTGGTEGWVDRVDRATIEVYAPGPDAVKVAEAIRAAIVGHGHELEAGYIDEISCDITPHDVPHQAETVNLARAGYLVTTRPL